MPQVYKRETERATKTPLDVMQRAANDGKWKGLTCYSQRFHIDKMTLNRFIAKRRTNPTAVTGYAAVAIALRFPTRNGEGPRKSCQMLSDMFYGLSLEKCCVLAYEFASHSMAKSWEENKTAGKAWWLGINSGNILLPITRVCISHQSHFKEFYGLAQVMDTNSLDLKHPQSRWDWLYHSPIKTS